MKIGQFIYALDVGVDRHNYRFALMEVLEIS